MLRLEDTLKQRWVDAVKEDIQSLVTNETWTLVKLPKGKSLVDNKWIFKVKVDADKNAKYKTRIVTKGFFHLYGKYVTYRTQK